MIRSWASRDVDCQTCPAIEYCSWKLQVAETVWNMSFMFSSFAGRGLVGNFFCRIQGELLLHFLEKILLSAVKGQIPGKHDVDQNAHAPPVNPMQGREPNPLS